MDNFNHFKTKTKKVWNQTSIFKVVNFQITTLSGKIRERHAHYFKINWTQYYLFIFPINHFTLITWLSVSLPDNIQDPHHLHSASLLSPLDMAILRETPISLGPDIINVLRLSWMWLYFLHPTLHSTHCSSNCKSASALHQRQLPQGQEACPRVPRRYLG